MALTSQRRIPVARDFVRIGFGEAVDGNAPFYSHEFITQELTTSEAQEVIPVLRRYNDFDGEQVGRAIGRFKGRVSGWKFGSVGSPILVVLLAPWTHQIEDVKPGGKPGTKISPTDCAKLASELKAMFVSELELIDSAAMAKVV